MITEHNYAELKRFARTRIWQWKRGSIGRIVKIQYEPVSETYCLICFDKTCTETHTLL